jgi:hypothetical protein
MTLTSTFDRPFKAFPSPTLEGAFYKALAGM